MWNSIPDTVVTLKQIKTSVSKHHQVWLALERKSLTLDPTTIYYDDQASRSNLAYQSEKPGIQLGTDGSNDIVSLMFNI